jgi:hypothetical protein
MLTFRLLTILALLTSCDFGAGQVQALSDPVAKPVGAGCVTVICLVCLHLVSFFKAFVLTFLIESFVLYLFTSETAISQTVKVALVANAISLPVVWFVLPLLITYSTYVLLAETFAVLSESLVLRALLTISYKRCLLAAFTMNLTSFAIGWIFPTVIAP